jgi:hypothetical protein
MPGRLLTLLPRSFAAPVMAAGSISREMEIGITPTIIASEIEWGDEADRAERSTLLKQIGQWRSAWSIPAKPGSR